MSSRHHIFFAVESPASHNTHPLVSKTEKDALDRLRSDTETGFRSYRVFDLWRQRSDAHFSPGALRSVNTKQEATHCARSGLHIEYHLKTFSTPLPHPQSVSVLCPRFYRQVRKRKITRSSHHATLGQVRATGSAVLYKPAVNTL